MDFEKNYDFFLEVRNIIYNFKNEQKDDITVKYVYILNKCMSDIYTFLNGNNFSNELKNENKKKFEELNKLLNLEIFDIYERNNDFYKNFSNKLENDKLNKNEENLYKAIKGMHIFYNTVLKKKKLQQDSTKIKDEVKERFLKICTK